MRANNRMRKIGVYVNYVGSEADGLRTSSRNLAICAGCDPPMSAVTRRRVKFAVLTRGLPLNEVLLFAHANGVPRALGSECKARGDALVMLLKRYAEAIAGQKR